MNNARGEIVEIRNYFVSPSIVVQAREKTLLEILHRADWVKAHPFLAVAQYAPRFSLVQGSFRNIPAYVVHFFTNTEKMDLTHSQPSI